MRLIKYVYDSVKSPFHEINEDKTLVIKTDQYCLFFLFDGVGSAKHALSAIEISSQFISDNYVKYEQNEKFQLSKLMYDAHIKILDSKLSEALSTYVAVFIPNRDDQEISVSSMGDSRMYGVSKQYMVQHTEDDNIPNIKNTITKSLGMLKLKNTDFVQNNFIPKESRYLLSSDGFYNLEENNVQKFHEILNFSRLINAKKALYKNVLGNNADDASYILIEIHV